MPTNDHDLNQPHRKKYTRSAETPGYETTDVNVGGVVVFLAGLLGFLVVFFVFCFVMGKVINGAVAGGRRQGRQVASVCSRQIDGKRQDLASNPEMEQKELNRLTSSFPSRAWISTTAIRRRPTCTRVKICCWTTTASLPQRDRPIRIPIERAMELIAQRGLPVSRSRLPQRP